MTLDQMQRAVQVANRFLMNRNPVDPGVCKNRNKLVGILDHQMTIERNVHRLAQGCDHGRADGDVGDEVTVHDINMEEGRTASHRGIGIFCQAGEISRQNGRRYLNQNTTSLTRDS